MLLGIVPSGRERRAGLGAGATDDHGKAFFGSPGPGSYHTTTLFNSSPESALESRAGKHVFPTAMPVTIKTRSVMKEWEADSPGPAAHTPSFNYIEASPKPANFGKASRDTEAKRFISRSQANTDGGDSPGPGAYRYKTGKGHAKTFGDGPCTKIGTAPRPAISSGADPAIPGAKYSVPSSMNCARGATIGPMNDRAQGLARDRVADGELSGKLYWGPGVAAPASADGPSALAYTPNELAVSAKHSSSPTVTFSKAPLDAEAKV